MKIEIFTQNALITLLSGFKTHKNVLITHSKTSCKDIYLRCGAVPWL